MSKLPKKVVIKLEEMKGPIEVWPVQLLQKNLQAHLTAKENAKRQLRTGLPQNVAVKNKFTTSPKRSSAKELIAQGRIGTYNFVVPGLSEPLF